MIAVSAPSTTEPRWFIVCGWLDSQEWGDEPPDPDDIWAVGDRVRLKNSTIEGTVCQYEQQNFLGGYIPYIRVQWDNKDFPTHIEPDLLIRLTRYIPPGLTWKAPNSFNDENLLSMQIAQDFDEKGATVPSEYVKGHDPASAITRILTKEHEYMHNSTNLLKYQAGDKIYVIKNKKRIKRVVGDRLGEGRNEGKILTLGGRSGHEEYWEDPRNLQLIEKAGDKNHTSDENVQVAQYDEELLRKVYLELPDDDLYVTAWEIAQDLGYEYTLIEVQRSLECLEQRNEAAKILNTDKNEVLWCKSLPSMTFVQESDLDLQQVQHSLMDLNSLDYAKSMNIAEISSTSDTQVFQLQETSELEKTLQGLSQELSQLHQTANHLVSLENGGGQTTIAISSPPSSISSTIPNQTISVSKMYPEFYPVHTGVEEIPEGFLNGYCGSFPKGGIMSNGKLSVVPTLTLPSLEKDLFWLRSPQALSSSVSRPPGVSKLETQLKKLNLIGQQEVINPEFLAQGLYNLPTNWASLSEPRAATEILETSAKPMETVLTPDLERSPSPTSKDLSSPETVQLAQRTQQPTETVQLAQQFIWEGAGKYWIKPEWVKLDQGTQSRVETDKQTVIYYAEQMKADLWEWEASPVNLLWDGSSLLPCDGHHRLEAAVAAGKSIFAHIELGDLKTAIALSCGANKKPSLRRTVEDNRKTISMIEELRATHGDEWLLSIINAKLPTNKHFKSVSLRAMEYYTGIPYRTVKSIKDKAAKSSMLKSESPPKISFVPTTEEIQTIQLIMEVEGFSKATEAIAWLIDNYNKS